MGHLHTRTARRPGAGAGSGNFTAAAEPLLLATAAAATNGTALCKDLLLYASIPLVSIVLPTATSGSPCG